VVAIGPDNEVMTPRRRMHRLTCGLRVRKWRIAAIDGGNFRV